MRGSKPHERREYPRHSGGDGIALTALATRGSRGRGHDRETRSRLPYHGGEPLGRFGPFFLEPRELAVELPDLFAQRRALLLESVPFRLGGLRRLRRLVVSVQHPAHPVEDLRAVFHPPKHLLRRGSRHLAWHGSLSLAVRGRMPIMGGDASGPLTPPDDKVARHKGGAQARSVNRVPPVTRLAAVGWVEMGEMLGGVGSSRMRRAGR